MKKMERKETANKGFSLIELIIVIAIMAILIGVLAPQFLKYVEKSRKSTDMQSVDSIISAIEVYAIDPDITEDVMKAGTITLTLKPDEASTIAGDTTDLTDASKAALKNAGLGDADGDPKDIRLKSSKWNGGDVVITIEVKADGNVVPTCTGNPDILEGTKASAASSTAG